MEPYVLFLFVDGDRMERKDWKVDRLLRETLHEVDIEVQRTVLQLLRLYRSRV